MRYIKLYENYESYQEITEEEYYKKTLFGDVNNDNEDPLEDSNYIRSNWESYTKEELKEILTILPKGTKFTINAGMNPMYPKSKLDIMNIDTTISLSWDPIPVDYEKFLKDPSKLDFFIVKLKDEWYYLYVNHRAFPGSFWKCDQMNGLIKCMKNYL